MPQLYRAHGSIGLRNFEILKFCNLFIKLIKNKSVPFKSQGFTLIEVMIALLIFTIAIIPLLSMCGNTIRLTGKADNKISQANFSRELLNSAILGTLGDAQHEGLDGYIWQGKNSRGIKWQVIAKPWFIDGAKRLYDGRDNSDWYLYHATVAAETVSTIAPLSKVVSKVE